LAVINDDGEPVDLERQEIWRARWRRVRSEWRISDPGDEHFAQTGPALRVADVRVRLVVLPGDPETQLTLDDEAWTAFTDASMIRGRQNALGHEVGASPWGVVRYASTGTNGWESYVSLRRNGALDLGIGSPAIWSRNDLVGFRLVAIVGRILLALRIYRTLVEELQIAGPFAASLALTGTRDSVLGNLGTGWDRHGRGFRDVPTQHASALGEHWEVPQLDNESIVDGLAYRMADWLENCWGEQGHVYTPAKSEHSELDWSAFM
jgi:hypothetical protein